MGVDTQAEGEIRTELGDDAVALFALPQRHFGHAPFGDFLPKRRVRARELRRARRDPLFERVARALQHATPALPLRMDLHAEEQRTTAIQIASRPGGKCGACMSQTTSRGTERGERDREGPSRRSESATPICGVARWTSQAATSTASDSTASAATVATGGIPIATKPARIIP